ncbi:MAG: ARMT1-like domain-containing protein [Deltaproteobacteria bacterium]|nr:ARMT1-like domain-containing protein [Deltaproteobacteria bacterium]
MKTSVDCLSCFMDQTLRVARISSTDETVHLAAARAVAALLPQMEMSLTPPENAVAVYAAIARVAGCADPYLAIKKASNDQALAILPDLLREVQQSEVPLLAAIRLAIAANIIDYGAMRSFDVEAALARARTIPFVIDASRQLFERVCRLPGKKAKVLYLADNCGEIVYDSLVIRCFVELGLEVTVAVKEGPIINDALFADAMACGLDQYARIITNGTACPGTPLASCSAEFLHAFREADLVLSKGQGNFETLSEALSETDADIFFLLTVKCPVVGAHLARLTGKGVKELPGQGEMVLYCRELSVVG